MKAKELARLLVAAEAEWEPIAGGLGFPGKMEHRATCEAHGLLPSDPDMWSADRRRYLRRNLEQRLRVRRTPALPVGPPAAKPLGVPTRRAADIGVEAAS